MKAKAKRALLTLLALVFGVLGVQVITAGSAHAATDDWRSAYFFVDPATNLPVFWDHCRSGNVETIYLEQENLMCNEFLPPAWHGLPVHDHLYGYARLTTQSSTSHKVEVCSFIGASFSMSIDQANEDGSSSGHVVEYINYRNDPVCYSAVKGYKMRKFMAKWSGGLVSSSPWTLPA